MGELFMRPPASIWRSSGSSSGNRMEVELR
jgi:hypothetical protein